MSVKAIVMLIGLILMAVQAFGVSTRVNLFELGLAIFLGGFALL
jgi:hypothetical protein